MMRHYFTVRSALFCILAVALLTAGSPSRLQAAENPWTQTFYFENDLFTGTDRNYTNGVKYSIISPDLSIHATDAALPRKVLEYIHRLPYIKGSSANFSHQAEFSLGQNMYTPADISRSDLITNDRPYAGWTYMGMAYHRKNAFADRLDFLDTLEIQLGLIGPQSFAEESQKLVHELRNLQRPNGWSHQLANEPGGAIIFERKWLFHPNQEQVFGVDAITYAGAALGNVYTYANAGLEVRVGWNIPRNFGVSLIRPAGSTSLALDRSLRIFAFGASNNRIVLRDIFLDGNTFADSHRMSKNLAIADLAAGISIGWQRFMLTWSQVMRTPEFREQTDNHSFGSLTLTFSL